MRTAALWLGPILAAAAGVGGVYAGGLSPAAGWTAAVAVLCAVWWCFEPIPIPVTSLVPVALLPAVGALTADQAGAAFGSPLILLLLSGFLLSTAMERSGAHRRLALAMVRLCAFGVRGPTPRAREAWPDTPPQRVQAPAVSGRRLVIGFMLASAVVSMWVSNAATTLMLLPIAAATLEHAGPGRLRVALLLGIAYASSIGGVATPIGTPPNLICIEDFEKATNETLSFARWIAWGLPVAAVMLPLAAWRLTRGLGGPAPVALPSLGPWRSAEARTLAVFAATAAAWVFRTEPLGGWSKLLGVPGASDATVGLFAVVAMFLLPSGARPAAPGEPAPRLLDWESAVRVPWGMLLLYSGGMVLAAGFQESGLSAALGQRLHVLGAVPTPLLVSGLCLAVTFLTEVTSNTAITTLLMPVMAAMAEAIGVDARLLMLPVAVSASFAFMLPVGTPPNAVVYGMGGLPAGAMAREGLVLNLLGVVVVTGLALVLLAR